MIRLLHSYPDPEPCRKACSEYSLGLMPVHAGSNREDGRALSRLPEYSDYPERYIRKRYIMTDGVVMRYMWSGYSLNVSQFGIKVDVINLYFYPELISWKWIERLNGQMGCITIQDAKWTVKWVVNDCAVGGPMPNSYCGCKRGEPTVFFFKIQHAS